MKKTGLPYGGNPGLIDGIILILSTIYLGYRAFYVTFNLLDIILSAFLLAYLQVLIFLAYVFREHHKGCCSLRTPKEK